MTRDSQNFKLLKKRKIMVGVSFLVIVFFITILRGGMLFPKEDPMQLSTQEEPLSSALSNEDKGSESKKENMVEAEKEITEIQMIIHVAGAVSKPGIVFLPEGSRVYQAIEAVGGVLSDSDLRDINLAAELLDGERVYVPLQQEYQDQETSAVHAPSSSQKININTADSTMLQRLSGVGPAMAERILAYRKENGRFKDIADLKNVKGIGDKTFEKMKSMVSVT